MILSRKNNEGIAEMVYANVNPEAGKEGNQHLRIIIWKECIRYAVERIKQICCAASIKLRGGGIDYNVVVCGDKTYLFNEEEGWFAEEKEYN